LFDGLDKLVEIRKKSKADVLFSIKSLAEVNTLKLIAEVVDGFSTSSLFEARLVHDEVKISRDRVHIVSPGLKEEDIREIAYYAGNINYNSIEQAKRLHPLIKQQYNAGIRVNTGVSSVSEARYDPCKIGSKLGVPIGDLKKRWKELDFVKMIHFHTNCEGTNPEELLENVRELLKLEFLDKVLCVNIGGGYYFHEIKDLSPLYEAIELLKDRGVKVIMEPGGTVVKQAGSMIASVTDIFENSGKKIAIIDASVNHLPEVLEYNFKLDVGESVGVSKHEYIVAGPTCLAGDDFGTYYFAEPLEIGSRITFMNVGSYSMVKSHMFNGVNLPDIYTTNLSGKLTLRKSFDYSDFRSKWV